MYSDSPGGEPGNDDLGSMSSWYVWASLGIYPETPGTTVLALDAPIFSRAEFDIPGSPRVTISAPGASTSSYIQGVTVNGRPSPAAWVNGTIFGVSGAPAGQLAWQGPVANGVGSVPGTITPDVTTPRGASAVEWQEADAAPNTWIWLNPASDLTGGQTYQATITLQGTGDVYLDFYNGQEDLTSETVQLTSAPVTLTLDGEVPSDYSTPFQVRTAAAGPVDLYASGASIQLLTLQSGG